LISYRPVLPSEYRKTGYDKGHLASAADMTYSIDTMTQSFYMSNISPQLPGFNRGIWKRLETFVREVARKEGVVLVVTGPIFDPEDQIISLNNTDIPIPTAFYKILFDVTPPQKIIGFVIPNAASKKPLQAFTVTVDNVESLTGLQFFPKFGIDQRKAAETNITITDWNVSR
jgi:endonuclease G